LKKIFYKNYKKNNSDNYILEKDITDEDKNKIEILLDKTGFENKSVKGAVFKRKEIKNSLLYTLNNIKELLIISHLRIIINMVKKGLLNKIETNESCTATYATIILNNQIFRDIMSYIKNEKPDDYNELKKIIDEKEKFCLKSG